MFWDDGTVFESEHALMELGSKVWALFLLERPDAVTTLSPEPGTNQVLDPGKSRGSFRIRKAETSLEGWLGDRRIGYELELTFRDPDGILNHAMIDLDTLGDGRLKLAFGQFKAGFGKQELVSSSRQQFVDRSFVSDEFSPAEQQGVELHGQLFAKRLEYRLGLYNGNGKNGSGRNAKVNDNGKFQYDARLQWEPLGEVGYGESDFESNGRPLLALGIEAQHDDRRGATRDGGARWLTLGGDLTLKWRGLFVFGQMFLRDSLPEAGEANGFGTAALALQAGYFVWQRTLEVAARHATLDPDRKSDHDQQYETGGAFSWYIRARALKVQTDLRRVADTAANTVAWEWRLQTFFRF